jgi:DNA-binding PadR family transcriptional regulator
LDRLEAKKLVASHRRGRRRISVAITDLGAEDVESRRNAAIQDLHEYGATGQELLKRLGFTPRRG